jgi:hypothetical protein
VASIKAEGREPGRRAHLTARRAGLEVKLTDAAGALAVAVDERRRRRSSNRSNGKSKDLQAIEEITLDWGRGSL